MSAGRPSEYKEEYIQEVDKYLDECKDEFDEYHKTRGDKSDSYERVIKVKLPTIEGFALRLGVCIKSLYNWGDEKKEFLHALDKIKAEQKRRLIDMGLSGDYNPTIAKLILSSNHGMKERSDFTTKDKEFNMSNLLKDLSDEKRESKR